MDTLLCFNCSQENEDMLVLGCKHALCLLCAYTLLTRDDKKYQYKFISCDICKELTSIETETLKEIFAHSNNFKNSSTIKADNSAFANNTNNSRLGQSLILNNRNYLLNPDKLINANNNTKLFCSKHNEEVTYFCFDCFQKCICAECVVHGEHKNHNVLNIKKAYPLIIEKANDFINEISCRINDMALITNNLESKKKEISKSCESIKTEMKCAFNEIRQRLDKKEKELLSKADECMEEHFQEINTFSRILQGKLISLNKTVDNINSNLMRKDEPAFINYFSESQEKIRMYLDEELQNLTEIASVNSLRININVDTLNHMISNLNGIHLEISSLKGVEINRNAFRKLGPISTGYLDPLSLHERNHFNAERRDIISNYNNVI